MKKIISIIVILICVFVFTINTFAYTPLQNVQGMILATPVVLSMTDNGVVTSYALPNTKTQGSYTTEDGRFIVTTAWVNVNSSKSYLDITLTPVAGEDFGNQFQLLMRGYMTRYEGITVGFKNISQEDSPPPIRVESRYKHAIMDSDGIGFTESDVVVSNHVFTGTGVNWLPSGIYSQNGVIMVNDTRTFIVDLFPNGETAIVVRIYKLTTADVQNITGTIANEASQIDGSDVFGGFANGFAKIFSTPIFGTLSLGTLLYPILALVVVLVAIKFFAGG